MATTADQNTVREHNTALILSTLRQHKTLSRASLAARTGLNRSTVSSIITELIEAHAVEETILQSEKIGRPGMLLRLNPRYGCAIGVDVNVDYINVVVLDYTYEIMWQKNIAIPSPTQQVNVLHQAIELTGEALRFGREHGMQPLGIGVAIPGLVDIHQGTLILGPNLGWKEVPIRTLWEEQFALPVFVENDANTAAMGEYYTGAAQGVPHFICINVGVGIGGGIMIDGTLLRGSRGFASEIGHMLIDPEGSPCACGSRGCLETVIGKTALIHSVQEALRAAPQVQPFITDAAIHNVTLDQIVQAAAEGHPVCIQQLQLAGHSLGLVVGDLVNIFNPEMVVIGGYSTEMVTALLPDIRTSTQERSMHLSREARVEIKPSRYGPFSSVIGAAALVYDHLTQPVF